MRAAGAKRWRARRDVDVERAGLLDKLDSALDALGIEFQIRIMEKLPERREPVNENARIQSPRRRDAFESGGELFAPDVRAIRGGCGLVELADDLADLFLHEPAALFDNENAAHLRAKLLDKLRINRVADAEFQDR